MESSLKITAADFDDPVHAAAIVDLTDQLARHGGGDPLSAAVRRDLVDRLRRHPGAIVLFGLLGEQPVGLATCLLGFSTFYARPLINIHDLVVAEEARGRGVGQALLAAVEDEARRRNCCKITLEVDQDNHAARRLYQMHGFGNPSGNAQPQLFLAKRME